MLSPTFKDTLYLRFFSFLKIPLLFGVGPQVLELTEEKTVIRVPLKRFNKNHLGSMYFAVLAAGADCAGGLIAMKLITASKKRVDLIFKDFHADFYKRAEGDTHFVCTQGAAIGELVKKAIETKERVTMPVEILAYVPSKNETEPVAKFTLGLSLKARS